MAITPGRLTQKAPAPEERGLVFSIITIVVILVPRELVIQENIDICVYLAFSILIIIPNPDDKIV